MERNAIRIFTLIRGGPKTVKELSLSIGLSRSRTSELVKKLAQMGLLERHGALISYGPLAHILLPLLDRYDIERLLSGSRERLLGFLLIPKTMA